MQNLVEPAPNGRLVWLCQGVIFPSMVLRSCATNWQRLCHFCKRQHRLIRQYGSEAQQIFAEADSAEALGNDFGSGIYQRELDWAIGQEWVHEADDFLWRRSKLGLRVSADQRQAIEGYIAAALSAKARVA